MILQVEKAKSVQQCMDSTTSVVKERDGKGNMEICRLAVYPQCVSERIHKMFIPLILFKMSNDDYKQEWLDDFSYFQAFWILYSMKVLAVLKKFKLLKMTFL